MKIQNLSNAHYTNFRAKESIPGNLARAFLFIIKHANDPKYNNNDVFIKTEENAQVNDKVSVGEISAEPSPYEVQVDEVVTDEQAPADNKAGVPREVVPAEEDSLKNVTSEEISASPAEEAVVCDEAQVADEAELQAENVPAEEGDLEAVFDDQAGNNTPRTSGRRAIDLSDIPRGKRRTHKNPYGEPVNPEGSIVNAQEAAKTEKAEQSVNTPEVQNEIKTLLNERLDAYTKDKKQQLSVSDEMFDYVCKHMKPETIRAVKSNELLYLMVAEKKVIEGMFRKDTLENNERIKKLCDFEKIFSPEKIEKITMNDDNNSISLTCLAKWLFSFLSIDIAQQISNRLQYSPEYNQSGMEFSILKHKFVGMPEPVSPKRRGFKRFRKNN